jgi:NET1-associated nuclear protein 1 (U3 small nucleolar RNA-associated protein 17)
MDIFNTRYPFNAGKQIKSSLHWHAHKVKSIAFASGSYMLSGGEEGVLVLWQLKTRHQDYLPRLGSDIVQISVSPNQQYYALVFKDNSIRIINAVNLSVRQTIMGLKYASVDHKRYPPSVGLVIEPKENNEYKRINKIIKSLSQKV